MKSFLLIFAVMFASCTTSRAPFLDSMEVKNRSAGIPDCVERVKALAKESGLDHVETGVTPNRMGIYSIFANDKGDGMSITLASPGYDWTVERNFHRAEFLGTCRTEENRYYLIYRLRAKLNPGV